MSGNIDNISVSTVGLLADELKASGDGVHVEAIEFCCVDCAGDIDTADFNFKALVRILKPSKKSKSPSFVDTNTAESEPVQSKEPGDEVHKYCARCRQLLSSESDELSPIAAAPPPIDQSSSLTKAAKPYIPILMQIAKTSSGVGGVALVDKQLYAVRWGSHFVYEYALYSDKIQRQRRFTASSHSIPRGLAYSSSENALFVADYESSLVHRVDLADKGLCIMTNWVVECAPTGVSIGRTSGNVVVTCSGSNTVEIYTTRGFGVFSIQLPAELRTAWDAVELPGGECYAVSHSGSVFHRVSMIDKRGCVLQFFPEVDGSPFDRLIEPRQLAVDSRGNVLVADSGSNRIVVLNSTLTASRVLQLPVVGGLQQPWCLCLDESQNVLCVGEWRNRRIISFKNIVDALA